METVSNSGSENFREQTEEQKQYKATKDSFKSEIKKLGEAQHLEKELMKLGNNPKSSAAQSHVAHRAVTIRHTLIAYGLFRGRKIEKIETPKKGQKLRPFNPFTVKSIADKHATQQKTVRYSEGQS